MVRMGKWTRSAVIPYISIMFMLAGCQTSPQGDTASTSAKEVVSAPSTIPSRQTNPPAAMQDTKRQTDGSTVTAAPSKAEPLTDTAVYPAQSTTASTTEKPQPPSASASSAETSILEVKDEDASAKAKPDSPKGFSHAKPSLLGLRIGDSKDSVIAQYGEANHHFVMDDGESPITVYEYKGFSAGFTTKGSLEFVEIESADIDPGLNGLRLNDKAEDALKDLGQPDSNTSYVMSYLSKSCVLKLDIDPKTNIIHSIKLFAK